MSFSPIAETIPNYRDFKNNWLKAFVPGTTTTPKVMATDATGATTVDKFELDKDGFPNTSGGALVIPYIDGAYDLWLFPTEAEADANDTVNAKRFAVNVEATGANVLIDRLNPSTIAIAIADSTLEENDILHIGDRSVGNQVWKVVLASSVTTNPWDKRLSTGVGTLAIVLQHFGTVNIVDYGFVADGAKGAATGTDNSDALKALVADVTITKLKGAPGVFFFGALGVDEILADVTTTTNMDWGAAYITVNGDNSQSNTGMVFVRFNDINGSMGNFEFEDITFDVETSVGRGVVPVQIRNASSNTAGYDIGPMHIVKGQALLQGTASSPNSFRASDIRLVGAVHGDNMYYGVNLADNCDNMSGHYTVDKANRAAFVYGVNDVDLSFFCREGIASSSNLFISNSGGGLPVTKNIKIRAQFDILNGAIAVADQPSSADGIYESIDIKVIVNSLGSNLTVDSPIFRVGAFDSGGAYLASGTTTIRDLSYDLDTNLALTLPIQIETDSPNYGTLTLQAGSRYDLLDDYSTFVLQVGSYITKTLRGAPNALNVDIPQRLITGLPKNALIKLRATVGAHNDTTGSESSVADFWLQGVVNSSGVVSALDQTAITQRNIGGTAPVFTIAGSGSNIRLTCSADYSNSNGTLRLNLERV